MVDGLGFGALAVILTLPGRNGVIGRYRGDILLAIYLAYLLTILGFRCFWIEFFADSISLFIRINEFLNAAIGRSCSVGYGVFGNYRANFGLKRKYETDP